MWGGWIFLILCPFALRIFFRPVHELRFLRGLSFYHQSRVIEFLWNKAQNKSGVTIKDILSLLREVIGSFSSVRVGVGLPLGNLTSQLLVNVYMNEFDQFVKHKLKAKHYIRYSDDFIFLSDNRKQLETYIPIISDFLEQKLQLTLHPQKVFIKTLASGVDFLGWVHFPDHRVLRTTTKRRLLKRVGDNPKPETIDSYAGLLIHGNARKLRNHVLRRF